MEENNNLTSDNKDSLSTADVYEKANDAATKPVSAFDSSETKTTSGPSYYTAPESTNTTTEQPASPFSANTSANGQTSSPFSPSGSTSEQTSSPFSANNDSVTTETASTTFSNDTYSTSDTSVTDNTYYTPSSTYAGGSVSTSTPAEVSNGFAIASLVLGILSIICVCCCAGLGLLLGIAGIVFGCLQPKNAEGKKPGMAIAGLITSGIGIVLCLISMIAGFALTAYSDALGSSIY